MANVMRMNDCLGAHGSESKRPRSDIVSYHDIDAEVASLPSSKSTRSAPPRVNRASLTDSTPRCLEAGRQDYQHGRRLRFHSLRRQTALRLRQIGAEEGLKTEKDAYCRGMLASRAGRYRHGRSRRAAAQHTTN